MDPIHLHLWSDSPSPMYLVYYCIVPINYYYIRSMRGDTQFAVPNFLYFFTSDLIYYYFMRRMRGDTQFASRSRKNF